MILDASIPSGYLVPGAFGPYSTASFTLIVYQFVSFEDATLTVPLSFESASLQPPLVFSGESLEPV